LSHCQRRYGGAGGLGGEEDNDNNDDDDNDYHIRDTAVQWLSECMLSAGISLTKSKRLEENKCAEI
jgi:hypothetical protein